jgi:hypothetical protein
MLNEAVQSLCENAVLAFPKVKFRVIEFIESALKLREGQASLLLTVGAFILDFLQFSLETIPKMAVHCCSRLVHPLLKTIFDGIRSGQGGATGLKDSVLWKKWKGLHLAFCSISLKTAAAASPPDIDVVVGILRYTERAVLCLSYPGSRPNRLRVSDNPDSFLIESVANSGAGNSPEVSELLQGMLQMFRDMVVDVALLPSSSGSPRCAQIIRSTALNCMCVFIEFRPQHELILEAIPRLYDDIIANYDPDQHGMVLWRLLETHGEKIKATHPKISILSIIKSKEAVPAQESSSSKDHANLKRPLSQTAEQGGGTKQTEGSRNKKAKTEGHTSAQEADVTIVPTRKPWPPPLTNAHVLGPNIALTQFTSPSSMAFFQHTLPP